MPTAIDFPVDQAKFPQRCVGCGATPDTTVSVDCIRGLDLLLIQFCHWHEFALPSCSSCKARRKRAGILFGVLSFFATLGVLFGMFALEPLFEASGQRDLWLWLTLGTFCVAVYFARNWVSPLLDAWLLGVRGVRLTRSGIGTLQFRDRDFAAEAAALTQKEGTTSGDT